MGCRVLIGTGHVMRYALLVILKQAFYGIARCIAEFTQAREVPVLCQKSQSTTPILFPNTDFYVNIPSTPRSSTSSITFRCYKKSLLISHVSHAFYVNSPSGCVLHVVILVKSVN